VQSRRIRVPRMTIDESCVGVSLSLFPHQHRARLPRTSGIRNEDPSFGVGLSDWGRQNFIQYKFWA
jgi:hypothetical protein